MPTINRKKKTKEEYYLKIILDTGITHLQQYPVLFIAYYELYIS